VHSIKAALRYSFLRRQRKEAGMINSREVIGFLALIGLVLFIGQSPMVRDGLDNLGDTMRVWYQRNLG
jgi:hypothetical protein